MISWKFLLITQNCSYCIITNLYEVGSLDLTWRSDQRWSGDKNFMEGARGIWWGMQKTAARSASLFRYPRKPRGCSQQPSPSGRQLICTYSAAFRDDERSPYDCLFICDHLCTWRKCRGTYGYIQFDLVHTISKLSRLTNPYRPILSLYPCIERTHPETMWFASPPGELLAVKRLLWSASRRTRSPPSSGRWKISVSSNIQRLSGKLSTTKSAC